MIATVRRCRSCGKTHTVDFKEAPALQEIEIQGTSARYTHEAKCPNTGERLIWGLGAGCWTHKEA